MKVSIIKGTTNPAQLPMHPTAADVTAIGPRSKL